MQEDKTQQVREYREDCPYPIIAPDEMLTDHISRQYGVALEDGDCLTLGGSAENREVAIEMARAFWKILPDGVARYGTVYVVDNFDQQTTQLTIDKNGENDYEGKYS